MLSDTTTDTDTKEDEHPSQAMIALRHARMEEARGQADLLRALADPYRLQILGLLARHRRMCVSELITYFALSPTCISFHLNKLRTAGLIDYTKDGSYNYYFVRAEALKRAYDAIYGLVPHPMKLRRGA